MAQIFMPEKMIKVLSDTLQLKYEKQEKKKSSGLCTRQNKVTYRLWIEELSAALFYIDQAKENLLTRHQYRQADILQVHRKTLSAGATQASSQIRQILPVFIFFSSTAASIDDLLASV